MSKIVSLPPLLLKTIILGAAFFGSIMVHAQTNLIWREAAGEMPADGANGIVPLGVGKYGLVYSYTIGSGELVFTGGFSTALGKLWEESSYGNGVVITTGYDDYAGELLVAQGPLPGEILRYGTSGSMTKIDSTFNACYWGLTIDPAGNAYSIYDTLPSRPSVVSYDPSGSLIYAVEDTTLRNFVVLGYAQGTIIAYKHPETVGDSTTYSVVGISPANGTVQWRDDFAYGVGLVRPYHVTLSPNGEIVHAAVGVHPAGMMQLEVRVYDANGNLNQTYSHPFGGSYIPVNLTDVTFFPSGTAVMAFEQVDTTLLLPTTNTGSIFTQFNANSKASLLAFDTTGVLSWSQDYFGNLGPILGNSVSDLAIDSDGNLWAAMSLSDTTEIFGDTTGGIVYCLLNQTCFEISAWKAVLSKIDSTGALLQSYAFEDSLFDFGNLVYPHTPDSILFLHSVADFTMNSGTKGYLEFYEVMPDTNNRSGTYRIGGSNPDYADITSAIADLDGRHQMDDIVYIIDDGVYNEQIDLGSTITWTKENPDLEVYFKADDAPNTVVTVKYASNVLEIDSKEHVHFIGIDFQSLTANVTTCVIDDAVDIGIHASEITALSLGQTALDVDNTSGLTMTDVVVRNHVDGISLNGGSGDKLNLLDVLVTGIALDAQSEDGLEVKSAKLKTIVNGSTPRTAVRLQSLQGNVEFSGNATDGKVYLASNDANLHMEGNDLLSAQGFALDISANLGSISAERNTLDGPADGAIRINCNDVNDPDCLGAPTSTATRNITLIGNTLDAGDHGIYSNGLPYTELVVARNTVLAQTGIRIESAASASNNARLHSNVLNASAEGLVLQSSTIPVAVEMNTIIGNSTSSTSGAILVNGADSMSFCGNIAVNEAGGWVVYFATSPTGLSTQYNDWYNNTATVTNDPTLIMSSTDQTVDPKFVGSGDYHLSHRSSLLDNPIPCFDTTMAIDLESGQRIPLEADAGALETPNDAWSGADIVFILEDGVAFTAGGTGSYTEFRIDGLTNYTSVNLTMTDESGTIVYQSTSKTTFWDGHDLSSQIVPEGAYRYSLDLDSKHLDGFIYVKN